MCVPHRVSQEITALQGEAARLEEQLAQATARVSALVEECDDVRLAAEKERLAAAEKEKRLGDELRQSQQRLQDSSRMLQVCKRAAKEPQKRCCGYAKEPHVTR